ncbi:hypothetical protein [Chloroflexus aurantiacus]
MPRRVSVCQRIVQRVGVAVQVLRGGRAAAGAVSPITLRGIALDTIGLGLFPTRERTE